MLPQCSSRIETDDEPWMARTAADDDDDDDDDDSNNNDPHRRRRCHRHPKRRRRRRSDARRCRFAGVPLFLFLAALALRAGNRESAGGAAVVGFATVTAFGGGVAARRSRMAFRSSSSYAASQRPSPTTTTTTTALRHSPHRSSASTQHTRRKTGTGGGGGGSAAGRGRGSGGGGGNAVVEKLSPLASPPEARRLSAAQALEEQRRRRRQEEGGDGGEAETAAAAAVAKAAADFDAAAVILQSLEASVGEVGSGGGRQRREGGAGGMVSLSSQGGSSSPPAHNHNRPRGRPASVPGAMNLTTMRRIARAEEQQQSQGTSSSSMLREAPALYGEGNAAERRLAASALVDHMDRVVKRAMGDDEPRPTRPAGVDDDNNNNNKRTGEGTRGTDMGKPNKTMTKSSRATPPMPPSSRPVSAPSLLVIDGKGEEETQQQQQPKRGRGRPPRWRGNNGSNGSGGETTTFAALGVSTTSSWTRGSETTKGTSTAAKASTTKKGKAAGGDARSGAAAAAKKKKRGRKPGSTNSSLTLTAPNAPASANGMAAPAKKKRGRKPGSSNSHSNNKSNKRGESGVNKNRPTIAAATADPAAAAASTEEAASPSASPAIKTESDNNDGDSKPAAKKPRKRVVKNLPKSRNRDKVKLDENGIPDSVINKKGAAADPLNLQRYYRTELLTKHEEYSLGVKVQFMMKCEAVHEGLSQELMRTPTLGEWAAACGFMEYDPVMSRDDYVETDHDAQIRPAGTDEPELDPNMFVGNGLVNDSGVGRGKGRAKKPPPVQLKDFYDDSFVKFEEKEGNSNNKRNKAAVAAGDDGGVGSRSEVGDDDGDPFEMRHLTARGQPVNRGSPRDFVNMMLTAKEAKQRMVQCNMRLVVSIARRYHNVGVNVQDLVQEGSLGLSRAAEKFDPKRGFKFSTYASWWIQQAVFRSIAYHSRTIRLPVHVHNLLNRVRKVRQSLQQELGRMPSNEEVANQLGMTVEKYNRMIRTTRRVISLEMPKFQNNPKDLGHESEALIGDMIDASTVVNDENTPEQNVDQGLFKDDLQEMLKVLGEDERRVICARYGIEDGFTRTVTAVAAQMRQSKSWVRSQECRALRKLRRPWYEKRLQEHKASLSGQQPPAT